MAGVRRKGNSDNVEVFDGTQGAHRAIHFVRDVLAAQKVVLASEWGGRAGLTLVSIS